MFDPPSAPTSLEAVKCNILSYPGWFLNVTASGLPRVVPRLEVLYGYKGLYYLIPPDYLTTLLCCECCRSCPDWNFCRSFIEQVETLLLSFFHTRPRCCHLCKTRCDLGENVRLCRCGECSVIISLWICTESIHRVSNHSATTVRICRDAELGWTAPLNVRNTLLNM